MRTLYWILGLAALGTGAYYLNNRYKLLGDGTDESNANKPSEATPEATKAPRTFNVNFNRGTS